MMVAILDAMNRLGIRHALLGRGTICCRMTISGDTLSLPRQMYFYWWLFTLSCVHLILIYGTRPTIVQDNEDMTALYSEYTDVTVQCLGKSITICYLSMRN